VPRVTALHDRPRSFGGHIDRSAAKGYQRPRPDGRCPEPWTGHSRSSPAVRSEPAALARGRLDWAGFTRTPIALPPLRPG